MADITKISYEDLQGIIDSNHCSQALHRVNYFVRDFVVTDGIIEFCDAGDAHWLCDVVASYIYKLHKIEDWFFMINVTANDKHACVFSILNEVEGERKKQIKQVIHFTDLPAGEYEFYLIKNEKYYVMMCKGEY